MVRFTHNERGAAAVEFAIVLPLLVLLVFGIVQFSIAYNRVQGLHAAAREGARIAALSSTTQSEVETRVMKALDGVISDEDKDGVEIPPFDSCAGRPGESVTVTVSFKHKIDVPLWGVATPTLTGKGEFRCE